MVELTFHGAAETVTGSKYLLTAGETRVLFDCGLFQGLKELRQRNWAPLPFDVTRVDAVVLTHAHIDHLGFLPRVVRLGYQRPVYATPGTQDLASIMLMDAARNQEDDAEYANEHGFSKHRPALPLYDARDAADALKLFRQERRGVWFNPAGDIWCRYHDTGHLLGASQVEVEVRATDSPLRIVFSGDVGRYNAPLYHDPQSPPACDYLICESTYGNREHPDIEPLEQLEELVNQSQSRGGVLVVPSFAVGRAQQLIYLLQVLMHDKRIRPVTVYLDSPMSVDATRIYSLHGLDHDLSEGQLSGPASVLRGEHIKFARTAQESKRINAVKDSAIIIASSGMITGGRILHHLKRRLPDPANTILLGGFMAEGTRGRLLQDGARFLRIHGQDVPVRAKIVAMSSLSGHADHSELLRWLEPLPPPKQVFITHGELASATAFADELRQKRGWVTTVPKLGQTVRLA